MDGSTMCTPTIHPQTDNGLLEQVNTAFNTHVSLRGKIFSEHNFIQKNLEALGD